MQPSAVLVVSARSAACCSEAEARKNGAIVSIAILDSGGHLLHFSRMDEANAGTVDIAIGKARCAAMFRRPTKAFYDGIEAGHLFFLTFPGVAGAPGGVPIVIDGKLVGAIGVSGGNGEQDAQVSGTGAAASK